MLAVRSVSRMMGAAPVARPAGVRAFSAAKRPPGAFVAKTPNELYKVYSLRYEVYVEELKRTQYVGADSKKKILMDPLDQVEGTNNLFVLDEESNKAVGTVRVHVTVPEPYFRDRRLDSPSILGTYNNRPSCSYFSRHMIAPNYRSGSANSMICKAAVKVSRRAGVRFMVANIPAAMLPVYERVGWIRYGEVYQGVKQGLQVPICLGLEDPEFLDQASKDSGFGDGIRETSKERAIDQPAADQFMRLAQSRHPIHTSRRFYNQDQLREYILGKKSLSNSILFREFNQNQTDAFLFDGIGDWLSVIPISANTVVTSSGDMRHELFILLSGEALQVGEREADKMILEPGMAMGEDSFVSGLKRSNTTVTTTDGELLVIPRHAFLNALHKVPHQAGHVLLNIAQLMALKYGTKVDQVNSILQGIKKWLQ